MAYTYITFGTAKQLLANRLYDETSVFWKTAELGLLIQEALRTWNSLTGQWATEYAFNVNGASLPWLSLSGAGSPRQYTLTDTDLYTQIEYHLLEPPTGGTWTGTPQFSISDLKEAFQRRQDEILQLTACNVQNLSPVPLIANTRRVTLADNVLDVRRNRFKPIPAGNPNSTLWREDSASFQFFSPSYRQSTQTPRNYSVSLQTPLTVDVDFPPPVSGDLDILAVVSGTAPSPPSSTGLVIPNDWSWVLKFGMLGDLLGKESQARDELRMKYANARFAEGVQVMQRLPWLVGALVNNVPVAITGVKEQDTYAYGWEDDSAAFPAIVVAGTDLISVCPRPTVSTGITLQLVQNAPVPSGDSDPVQVSRDVFDVILDYAFHLASFKEGGQDFMDTMEQFDNFRNLAAQYNSHFDAIGPFRDFMEDQGHRQEDSEPRFMES